MACELDNTCLVQSGKIVIKRLFTWIFDNAEISSAIIESLYKRKNIPFDSIKIDRKTYKEIQYNILADEVRKNIDLELIYKIIEKGLA